MEGRQAGCPTGVSWAAFSTVGSGLHYEQPRDGILPVCPVENQPQDSYTWQGWGIIQRRRVFTSHQNNLWLLSKRFSSSWGGKLDIMRTCLSKCQCVVYFTFQHLISRQRNQSTVNRPTFPKLMSVRRAGFKRTSLWLQSYASLPRRSNKYWEGFSRDWEEGK